jgi:Uma2 family endonuclease
MSIGQALLSAAEFSRLPDPGHPQELVCGVVVDMPPPIPLHGLVCGNVYYLVRQFADQHNLGRAFTNDIGVVTERDPDTVRGPDVVYVSFAKCPAGSRPRDYFSFPPDAVFEVLSPSDRKSEVLRKVTEFVQLGVPAVYVLDPETTRVYCYYPDRPDEILNSSDELAGVGPLSGWRVPVARFFE